MKISDNRVYGRQVLDFVREGSLFEYDMHIYMKTNEKTGSCIKCVDMESGEINNFGSYILVRTTYGTIDLES